MFIFSPSLIKSQNCYRYYSDTQLQLVINLKKNEQKLLIIVVCQARNKR